MLNVGLMAVCRALNLYTSCTGLDDERAAEVLVALRAEAAKLAGEPALGQLVASATDLLTRFNVPSEACAFCLESQVPEEGGAGAGPPQLLRLPCYHCYHLCSPTPRQLAVELKYILCLVPWCPPCTDCRRMLGPLRLHQCLHLLYVVLASSSNLKFRC